MARAGNIFKKSNFIGLVVAVNDATLYSVERISYLVLLLITFLLLPSESKTGILVLCFPSSMKFFERGTYTTCEVDRALKFDYMKLKTFSALAKGVKFKKNHQKYVPTCNF